MTTPTRAADIVDARLRVETPERVELVYDLAGLGTRFLAGTFDFCILLIAWGLLFAVGALVTPLVAEMDRMGAQSAAMALSGAASAITWIYFLVLECVMAGQTPGKRLMRIRVVSVDGGSAPVGALLVRNLLRVVDMLPGVGLHMVAGLLMFATPRLQRLGDLAAGTVVVRERLGGRPSLGRIDDADELGEAFPPELVELAIAFVRRRNELGSDARERLGRELVTRVEELTGPTRLEPIDLLRHVASGSTVAALRELAAPEPTS